MFTDPLASPQISLLKVVPLEDSLSEERIYNQRPRICDLGDLREAYRMADGAIGYRCAAEPLTILDREGWKRAERRRTEVPLQRLAHQIRTPSGTKWGLCRARSCYRRQRSQRALKDASIQRIDLQGSRGREMAARLIATSGNGAGNRPTDSRLAPGLISHRTAVQTQPGF